MRNRSLGTKNNWIKQKALKLYRDEGGFSYSIFFLLIAPLIILIVVHSADSGRIQRTSHQSFQTAIDGALRDATLGVDDHLRAFGVLRLDHEKARNHFQESLGYNLAMINLEESETSSVENVEYWIMIYNGDIGPTQFQGLEAGTVVPYAMYYYNNGTVTSDIVNTDVPFPNSVGIDENLGFVSPGDASITTTIEKPSVVAIVKADIKTIDTNEVSTITRWAIGEIFDKPAEFANN